VAVGLAGLRQLAEASCIRIAAALAAVGAG
jgi:hypothetical protein